MERICVAIRVKPPSRQESSNGTQWKVVENTISLYNAFGTPIKGQTYSFDTIFGTGARNADIYNEHAKDLVLSAVSGFNGTVFAYGQTSSGKTYTMQGSGADPGVTRQAIRDVFTNIEKIDDREFLIRVSYMEIYNEEINDLLAPENRKLQIHESIERGIFVAGLREEIVDSVEQVIAVLERGEAQRHFGETNMNVNSSRSHTIFRMVIESRDKSHDSRQDSDPSAQDAVRVSALNMVDLAGSERISKTGAGGVRLKEGAHINKSLTTLGIVINKLSEGGGKQGAHIPYRDSKLTRILQSALGGNAKTAIICTINPDEIHIDETRGTLQFASRAKRVTNCAQVNEILTDAALLKRQKREIEDLRRRLQGSPHSEDLEKEILHLRNDLLKFELERERLELELQEEKKAQVERERRIKEQEQRIENLSTLVISGAMEDRELPNKKGNRRETWCPRVFNSDTLNQGIRRLTPGRDDFSVSASFDASMRPVPSRRDRTLGLPPAFESLVNDESDSFWSNASAVENSPALSDFGNVADEDTWASLNKGTTDFANVADEDTWASLNGGHVNIDIRYSNSLSDIGTRQGSRQAQFSVDAGDSSKIIMLEQQLKDMKLQYQELQTSLEVKIQEGVKEAVAAAKVFEVKSKHQELQDVSNRSSFPNSNGEALRVKELEAKVKDLEIELENCKKENSQLHDQLLDTKTALEQGVQERVSMDEENKFFRERLRSLEMGIQDDFHQQSDVASYMEDDFTPDSLDVTQSGNMCSACLSSMDKITEGLSMKDQAVDREGLTSSFLTESQVTQKFEASLPKVNKRRLFDDDEEVLRPANGMYELEKSQSCDELIHEVEYGLQHGLTGGNDAIVAALSCLCCHLKQLADPAADKERGRKEPSGTQEATNLRVSLTRARTLASQLLEELQSIVNHDSRCLESHAISKGTVGRNLETLQVLLLENADIALSLFHSLWSKEPLLTPKQLQQLIHEVAGGGARLTVVESGAKNLDENGCAMEPGRLLQKQVRCPPAKQAADSHLSDVDIGISLQQFWEQGEREAPQVLDFKQHHSTKSTGTLDNKKVLLEKCLSFTQSKLEAAEEEIAQLRRNIEESSSYQSEELSSAAIVHVDPCRGNHYADVYYFDQVGQRQSEDDDTVVISEYPEEDLCNFDPQPGIEQELGVAPYGLSQVAPDLQVAEDPKCADNNAESLQDIQGGDDNVTQEQRMMTNMSEAEKQFTMGLLKKVKALEVRLTVAEMEVVEYKVEMEHLRVNNLRASMEAPLDSGDWELQTLRAECEIQKEEIRQLMEQVMTPEAELERESLFQETMERNNFLEQCLKKAERRLIRAKAWREELLKLRGAEKLREMTQKSYHDIQARNARLEEEGVFLRHALSKAQRVQAAVAEDGGRADRHLDGTTKSEVLDEVQDMELQMLFAVGSMKRDGLATVPTSLCSTPRPMPTPSSHTRDLHPRPPRAVLGEVNTNSLNMLQSSLPKDLKNAGRHQHDVSKGPPPTSLLSEKENQPCYSTRFATSTH